MFLLVFLAAFLIPFTLFTTNTLEAETEAASAAGHARITIRSTRPLTLVGRGFHARETVRVRAGRAARRTRASSTGSFSLRFPGLGRCAVGTVVAVGSDGSRAALNVSSLLCLD